MFACDTCSASLFTYKRKITPSLRNRIKMHDFMKSSALGALTLGLQLPDSLGNTNQPKATAGPAWPSAGSALTLTKFKGNSFSPACNRPRATVSSLTPWPSGVSSVTASASPDWSCLREPAPQKPSSLIHRVIAIPMGAWREASQRQHHISASGDDASASFNSPGRSFRRTKEPTGAGVDAAGVDAAMASRPRGPDFGDPQVARLVSPARVPASRLGTRRGKGARVPASRTRADALVVPPALRAPRRRVRAGTRSGPSPGLLRRVGRRRRRLAGGGCQGAWLMTPVKHVQPH